ncbi:DUF2252 domain-containing protein [Methylocapsa palsarum]|uniref:Uncharacterized conserved protein, DUF2252 family n=1 Tax=Methylocapsa palsarum TaxID=1612308 RepID=A0A1I3ZU41_9HYPH|nr:DUF2252 domain-containing protein [Methylocapsa palsarum]SFK47568.1 Uncharacterized conserved protein, DUF2252 family [Methylocapsa palsarum]
MTEPPNTAAGARATRQERYVLGRKLRQRVARESHAQCPPAESRDPIAILTETDGARLSELLPIRYQRMAKSPFTFLRGAAAVMAHDLSGQASIGAHVQACGDCHLLNFGVFNTPESQILFDINDFDETLPGVDFAVDVKRLAASVAVAARDAGGSDRKAKSLARAAVESYREFILELAAKSPLQIWHTRMEIDRELELVGDDKLRGKLRSTIVKAKKDLDADDNFPHLAASKNGIASIENRPPLIYHFPAGADKDQTIKARTVFSIYRHSLLPERRALAEHYDLRDVAMKVVGVGSVGTFCAIGLFMSADSEPLFLQVKQALPSVLEKIAAPPAGWVNQGSRVADGQRALQAASDIFLSWTLDEKTNRFFYVRQLKNRRLGSIGEIIEAKALDVYANLCGRTLARAHARTGDPALIAGYMGKSAVFDDAIAAFAMAYAKQTDYDHACLVAALDPRTGLPTRTLERGAQGH